MARIGKCGGDIILNNGCRKELKSNDDYWWNNDFMIPTKYHYKCNKPIIDDYHTRAYREYHTKFNKPELHINEFKEV